MIAIIDYGMGNVHSIENMLKKIGVKSIITQDFDIIKKAEKLILPGVGSFDEGMRTLVTLGLYELIREEVLIKKKPILGICLGMQMLGLSSEEGNLSGLQLIPFRNVKFEKTPEKPIKIPHMGWKNVRVIKPNNDLVYELNDEYRFYFVHSYYPVCENPNHILMTCDYGQTITVSVHLDNIYGTQFHPEKSHKYGMKLLKNFAMRC